METNSRCSSSTLIETCVWCAAVTSAPYFVEAPNNATVWLCPACYAARRAAQAPQGIKAPAIKLTLAERVVMRIEGFFTALDNYSLAPIVGIGLLLGTGAGIHAGLDAIHAARVSYRVVIAGEDVGSTARSLVGAETRAHVLAGNAETEQEKGNPVLILDQDGKLIDTVTDR